MIVQREAVRHRDNVFPTLPEPPTPTSFVNSFLSCLYSIRTGLEEAGLTLSHREALIVILLKEYLSASGKIKITKREAYDGVIRLYLDFSFMTFNRLFNGLVRKHCFNPLGTRGNGAFGMAEEYSLTMVSKRIDSLLKATCLQ